MVQPTQERWLDDGQDIDQIILTAREDRLDDPNAVKRMRAFANRVDYFIAAAALRRRFDEASDPILIEGVNERVWTYKVRSDGLERRLRYDGRINRITLSIYRNNRRIWRGRYQTYRLEEVYEGSLVGVLRKGAGGLALFALGAAAGPGIEDSKIGKAAKHLVTVTLDAGYDTVEAGIEAALKDAGIRGHIHHDGDTVRVVIDALPPPRRRGGRP